MPTVACVPTRCLLPLIPAVCVLQGQKSLCAVRHTVASDARAAPIPAGEPLLQQVVLQPAISQPLYKGVEFIDRN